MSLLERITGDIAGAMREKNAGRLSALRMLKAALMNREVEKGRALDPAEELAVVGSLVKQRRDSIEQFAKGGREDLVAKERAEIGVLEAYQPPAASADDIAAAVEAAVAETGATTVKDMGRVMKAAVAKLAGKTADGKAVNDAVRKRLLGPGAAGGGA